MSIRTIGIVKLNVAWTRFRSKMPDSFSEGSFQEVVMRGVASVLLVLVVCVTAYAADIDGTWTGTVQTPMGDFPVTFTFKADGAKLTGSTMGFDGAEVP